jgi:hypothetical protein
MKEYLMIFSIRNHRPVQLRLFAPSEVTPDVFVDELDGYSLSDVKAFAIDPDLSMRRLAASSKWNIDANLQRTLCADPDEGVVMTLLSQVDPSMEMCDVIIDGPHVCARRDLARRNLRTEILARLAGDVDATTSALASARLAERGVTLEGARS